MTQHEREMAMQADGYIYIQEYFPWGKTPLWRQGTAHRFLDQGDILTPRELYQRLNATWRPTAREDIDYAASGKMRLAILAYEDGTADTLA